MLNMEGLTVQQNEEQSCSKTAMINECSNISKEGSLKGAYLTLDDLLCK